MAVPVRQNLCPASRYDIKCPYTRTPTRVVIHNTANDAPAENEISYMLSRPEEISFHYGVDDQEAVQGLPLDRNAWASGDGHGKGNMEGIHIEICYSLSGGARFAAAEKNAAWLTAQLLRQYGWGVEKVTKHQDYDGKYCPHRTLDLGWGRFVEMVKKELNTPEKEEEPDLTEAEARKIAQEEIGNYFAALEEKPVSGWAKKHVELVKERGIMNGDGDGAFRPGDVITREEVAATLVNALGLGKEASDYARQAFEKATQAGLLDGTMPREALTQEQFALVLDKLGLVPWAEEEAGEEPQQPAAPDDPQDPPGEDAPGGEAEKENG